MEGVPIAADAHEEDGQAEAEVTTHDATRVRAQRAATRERE